jgi:hypothetical protein
MEKIVEIANFQQADRAEVLASLLRSEGIDCYVRNEVSARTFGGLIDVGARVEVLESNAPRAREILEIGGFFLAEDDADESATAFQEAGKSSFFNKLSLHKQMLIILLLLTVLLAIFLYLGSFLSSPKF